MEKYLHKSPTNHRTTRGRSTSPRRYPAANGKDHTPRAVVAMFETAIAGKKFFAVIAAIVLAASTVVWSVLGALIQQGNADQLINAFLLEDGNALHGSILPSQHTFLLKWPFFFIVKLCNFSGDAYVIMTVLLALMTVGMLAYLLYRIVRRAPVPFGLLCLALACMLLPIPAQPYPGALLPVNMAMLTTRNLEYAVFLVALCLVAQLPKLSVKSWRLWVAAVLMALLLASDKLFLTLGLGGGLLVLAASALCKQWPVVRYAVRWLLVVIAAAAAGMGVLWMLNAWLLHVAGDNTISPYGFVSNWHDFALALIFSLAGLLTNLGANPASAAVEVKQLAGQAIDNLLAPGGLAFVINIALAAAGVAALWFLFWRPVQAKRPKRKNQPVDVPWLVAIMLVGATVAACGSFVITNHYYPVDARYETIVLFAVAVALAVYLRDHKLGAKWIFPVGAVLAVGIASGLLAAANNYQSDTAAMATNAQRNVKVADAMRQHAGTSVLLGDYWRVVPIKLAAKNAFDVYPLSGCTQPRNVLTSSAWERHSDSQPFAYLLTYDTKTADFPTCTLPQIVAAYGKPNASTVIAGTLDAPKEILMFYDHGIHSNANNNKPTPPTTVVPTTLEKYPNQPTCNGKTIFSVVAHEDDDLLFMNPDHLHALQSGACLRTLYITAGDAGSKDGQYWLGREKGSQDAYSLMDKLQKGVWVQRIVKLADRQYVTVATPLGADNISLIFMRLPDGNVHGTGFRQTHFESLARLESGAIKSVDSVDGQSTYTKDGLTATIQHFIDFYQPSQIDTQTPENMSKIYPDHSDHLAVGRYTRTAAQRDAAATGRQVPLRYYVGYPIHARAPNVAGQDYEDKARLFFTYSAQDPGGCQNFEVCKKHSVYDEYFKRQYWQNN